jgi:hypothetical protein
VRSGHLGDSGAANFLPWREVGQYLKEHVRDEDMVVTSRTGQVLYYFGRVDYCLDRQGDMEIRKYGYRTPDGRLLDNPGGAPYLEDTAQFEAALSTDRAVWLALQKSLFRSDKTRLSTREKDIIASQFRQAYVSPDASVVVFYRPRSRK